MADKRKIKNFDEKMFVAIDPQGMMMHTTIAFSLEICKSFLVSVTKKRWDALVAEGHTVNLVRVQFTVETPIVEKKIETTTEAVPVVAKK